MADKEIQKETLTLDKIKDFKANEIEGLKKGFSDLKRNIGDVLKRLDEKGKDYVRIKKEREEAEEKRLAEEKENAKANEAARLEAERVAAENAKKEAEERAKAEELARAKAQEEAEAKARAEERERLKAEMEAKKAAQAAQVAQRQEFRPAQGQNRREFTPGQGERRPFGDRPQGERKPFGDRPQGERRPYGDRPQGERKPFGDKPQGARPFGDRPQGGAGAPRMPRPMGGAPKMDMPAFPKESSKSFGPAKKKADGKSYDDKKATVSKRALISRELRIEDFEDKESGYRKLRVKKAKTKQQAPQIKIEKAVINTEIIAIKVLSEKLGITAAEITKRLFKEGIMKTINDTVDYDTAGFIAADLGIELELQLDKTAEDILNEASRDTETDEIAAVKRPPVIAVMGHVDHGKTSLLDRIRHTNVTEGEAGGITQHIGAYSVSVKGETVTFLDTPGHEAFTAMRMRGAQATDIAVIVIAADDGIMPQTVEAINHAKAAGVSIVIACNKIDKPTANIDRVKQELTEHGILIEEWGGDVMMVPVSAKTGENVDVLLENLILLAEVKELKCNPDRKARGVIIEAKLDKGKGPVATVLVQNGTLRTGDNIVAGTVVGRVRAMIDDKGRTVKEAGPSAAVSVLGLEDVPNTGDSLIAVEEEKLTKLVAEERRNKEREAMIHNASKVTLEDVFKQDIKSLNLIVKADVQGSVEAVKQSLVKLSTDEVKISVIHAAAGAITESDVMLAQSSKAVIIGFNVRPDSKAKVMAERSGVDVKLYRVIYEAIEDVEKALKGMLAPKMEDVLTGKAEVRDTFRITGVGTVAGCYVIEGKMVREGKLRIYRNDVMICEGAVRQLKRFKDDVKEVATGYECGISIENFNDIKNDDIIECYIVKEKE
ncbi:MAG: translation initiation factor IF-2 [Clostridiales bacterium]|nr:translation initiation factor IF-2 [Clostridiales bacterium]